jgi:hypothetical protein
MVINFRGHRISWGAPKLTRTPTLIIIIKKKKYAHGNVSIFLHLRGGGLLDSAR